MTGPTMRYLGLDLAALDAGAAARTIAERPADAPFAYVVTPNAQHVVALAGGDERFRAPYRRAWLTLCDSQILRGLARLLEGVPLPLASGSDVTARLFADHIRPDDPITIFGGDEVLAAALREKFGLTRMVWHAPPMGFIRDKGAVAACLDFAARHPARYVFLAMGAPQSEQLALRLLEQQGLTGTGLCIGSSLLFVTGRVARAPLWMRRAGLEWLYRLGRNPFGHARRVFLDSAPLLGLALRYRRRDAVRLHTPSDPP